MTKRERYAKVEEVARLVREAERLTPWDGDGWVWDPRPGYLPLARGWRYLYPPMVLV